MDCWRRRGSWIDRSAARRSRSSTSRGRVRRTLYGRIDRQNLPNLFRTFDFASPDTHSPRRFTTTVPQQALYLMNSPFVNDQARHLAARTDLAVLPEPSDKIIRLYEIVLARRPTDAELQLGMAFLDAEQEAPSDTVPDANLSPWQRYVQVVLLSNEFVFHRLKNCS